MNSIDRERDARAAVIIKKSKMADLPRIIKQLEDSIWLENKLLADAIKDRIKRVKKFAAKDPLRQQTEMFWLLQLQFMDMDRYRLGAIALYYLNSGVYRKNSKTPKAKLLADSPQSVSFQTEFKSLKECQLGVKAMDELAKAAKLRNNSMCVEVRK